MPQLFLNNFQTQFIANVKAAPESGAPAIELDYGILRVSDGAAGTLLNPGAGNWYVVTAFKRSGSAESSYEVMHVTEVNNSVLGECRLAVLRAQEGTVATAYVQGDLLELRLTAGGMGQYVQATDARLTNARVPTGAAGGVLSGGYPNPVFAQAMATAADLTGKVDKVADKGLSANDYTSADLAKLSGIAEQATKNATDALLRGRSTHTGEQAIVTVTGLQAALDVKEAAGAVAAHTAAPDPHPQYTTQTRASAAAPVQSVAGRTGAVVIDKADVGLEAVNNTSDTAKPVSTAQQAALNLKASLASPTFTGTVGGITKAMVGLPSVDNTSDASKPVSAAQAAAIALRYGKNNILGTVSQSAGVPTGALMEFGSNASGQYWKFAGGLLVCRNSGSITVTTVPAGNIHSATIGTWTFPHSFSTAPWAGFSLDGTVVWTNITSTGPTVTGALRTHSAVALTNDGIGIEFFAIGCWY